VTASTRPRDADATRRALLDAARALFAQDGYDATTVRAVADRAGVNQALLFRYFGNKEGLFVEAVRGRAMDLLSDGPPGELLDRLLSTVLRPADTPEVFLAVLRGAGSTQVAERLRDELDQAYTAALADLVDTSDRADAEARAHLLLAWLLGITIVRSTPGVRAAMSPETSLAHVRRAAQALLHG
jgi:AcrR family transcriptional regulator